MIVILAACLIGQTTASTDQPPPAPAGYHWQDPLPNGFPGQNAYWPPPVRDGYHWEFYGPGYWGPGGFLIQFDLIEVKDVPKPKPKPRRRRDERTGI